MKNPRLKLLMLLILVVLNILSPQNKIADKKYPLIKWVHVKDGPTGDIYISNTEITFKQYYSFCESTGYPKPKTKYRGDQQPIINVTYYDAVAFCIWISKISGSTTRLPISSEWTYAAKGGIVSKGYTYSGSNNLDEVGWHSGNSNNNTHEVASKKPNELGIYDMSGNVFEWCEPTTEMMGGTFGEILGGSWGNYEQCRINPKNILAISLESKNSGLGFRVIKLK